MTDTDDVIDTYASLRPDAVPISDVQLRALRATVFDKSSPVNTASDGGGVTDVSALADVEPGRSRESRRAVVAAGIVLMVGACGLWAVASERDVSGPSSEAPSGATATTVDATEPAPSASTMFSIAPRPTVPPGSELQLLLDAIGPVQVVNATGVDGLAASLTAALRGAGFVVREPLSAADGVRLDNSIVYDNGLMNAARFFVADRVGIDPYETISGQHTPGVSPSMAEGADAVVVLGDDLSDAPWESQRLEALPSDVGRLAVVDGTPNGTSEAATIVDRLRVAGVDVMTVPVDPEVATLLAREVPVGEPPLLMPVGRVMPWTYAIAELAKIGGFDTWSDDMILGELPADVRAVLFILG